MRCRPLAKGWKGWAIGVLGFVIGCARPPVDDGWSVERVWSEDPTRDQHHSTVAAFADGSAAVGWTDGRFTDPAHAARVRWVGADASPGLSVALADDVDAKPDLELDARGALLVGYEGVDGIDLERFSAPGVSARAAPVPGGAADHSVDLGLYPDGRIALLWYDVVDGLGVYRAATLGPDLLPAEGLAGDLATTDPISPIAPDVDVDPAGRVGVAWADQTEGTAEPDTLSLDLYVDGARAWRTTLAEEAEGLSPRRPAVIARTDGAWIVAWRARNEASDTPSAVRLAVVGADGTLVRAPVDLVDGDADEVTLAPIDDDRVWAVWVRITDPDNGQGVIDGGIWSVLDQEWEFGPEQVSDGDGDTRPHTDTFVHPDGTVTVVASYEHATLAGVGEIRGRVRRMP